MNGDSTRSTSRANTQETLEKELQATLGRAPAPRLSTAFENHLAARIAAADSFPEPLGPRDWLRHVVFLYWVLTAVAAFWILSQTQWASVPRSMVWHLVAAAISLLLPSVFLARQATWAEW